MNSGQPKGRTSLTGSCHPLTSYSMSSGPFQMSPQHSWCSLFGPRPPSLPQAKKHQVREIPQEGTVTLETGSRYWCQGKGVEQRLPLWGPGTLGW